MARALATMASRSPSRRFSPAATLAKAGGAADTDYSKFHSIEAPNGTGDEGYVVASDPETFPCLSPVPTPTEISSALHTEGSIYATLIVDPRGDIHATTGILPRTRIQLPADAVAAALNAMSLSVLTGPIFTQPFLTLSNVRAILHQGVGHWMDQLVEDGSEEDRLLKILKEPKEWV